MCTHVQIFILMQLLSLIFRREKKPKKCRVVPRGGIEPPTRGFSVFSRDVPRYVETLRNNVRIEAHGVHGG